MEKIYIQRELENKVQKYFKRKEIIAIVGARQCGKTTLMNHIFKGLKNAKFISFDDKKALQMFEQDIELFIKNYVENTDFLFIDEFQYAREGGRILKFIYDFHKTKILISGSSAVELSVQSIKYLVGRIFVFTLSPLSFHEFIKYKDKVIYEFLIRNSKLSEVVRDTLKRLYREYVLFGGYPEVVISKEKEEKTEIIKNIYNTYLLREIREILQISDDRGLMQLIKALALQVGNQINYNELSALTGYNYKELVKYLDILKKTFVCLESRPYFRNKRKEIAKAPKFYFLDTGFRNIAIDNFQDFDKRTDRGQLNENFVASELFKKEFELKYWRTKSGAEVDFVIESGGKLTPIEVKSVLKHPTYGKSLKNFMTEYKSLKGFVFSEDYENHIKLKDIDIFFRSLFSFEKELEKKQI
jgi:hypothetical protein